MKSNIKCILFVILISAIAFTSGYLIKPNEYNDNTNDGLNTILLPVYRMHPNEWKIEITDYIYIPDSLSVIKKMEKIAFELSSKYFKGLPIVIDSISYIENRKVAFINLKEQFAFVSWNGYYFQGSTGGEMTSVTLKYTFLQNEYKDEWIEGIRFTYEGEPLSNEYWDHIGWHEGLVWRDTVSNK